MARRKVCECGINLDKEGKCPRCDDIEGLRLHVKELQEQAVANAIESRRRLERCEAVLQAVQAALGGPCFLSQQVEAVLVEVKVWKKG